MIEGRIAMPFAWGSTRNDCISFMAAVQRAAHGVDPIAGLEWNDEDEAQTVIASLGGLEAAMSARMTPISAPLAHRFDAAMVDTDDGPMVMVVEGDMLVGPGVRRQRRLPRRMMRRAWTVRTS